MKQLHNAINDEFLGLYQKVYALEKKVLTVEEFTDITLNDVHIIEEVGMGEPRNMSEIAKALSVTVGSLTTAMNGLVRKEYVIRERGNRDRRVVYIRLTDKGEMVFRRHREFHEQITGALCADIDEKELARMTELLRRASERISVS